MEKNLNLVDILKNCPKGTKLYSIIHGEIELEEIIFNDHYPIKYKFIDRDGIYGMDRTTADGRHFSPSNGECTLFPSKNQRDWSKFNIESEMIDGEFYYCVYNYNQKENSFIFIYKKHIMYKTNYYAALDIHYSILFKNSLITNNNKIITELRKATEKEKQQLLYVIEREGYKWNEEKKELIEPKFDISTFQHFDKVLVRDYDKQMWKCDFYDSHVKNLNTPFRTINSWYKQCIPYNNETMHLVSTNKMPPEKYIIWENKL